MSETGWRTVLIEKASKLSLKNGCLNIAGETEMCFPLTQIRELLIANPQCTVTVPLLNELAAAHVNTLICNSKYEPSCEVISCSGHSGSAGMLLTQTRWKEERKADIWKAIVELKIQNQIQLLVLLDVEVPEKLYEYRDTVEAGDDTNREGLAARVYFASLFGPQFIRHTDDVVNAALDYGYALVRSSISRLIVLHGYSTALGIHHCSAANRFNLSCDLMEPFRPFVDRIVYSNFGRILDKDYKKELIGMFQGTARMNNKTVHFQTALETFVLDVMKAMSGEELRIKEVGHY